VDSPQREIPVNSRSIGSIGQNKPKEMGKFIYLELSDSRIYNLEMEVLTKTAQIDEFVESAG
jgi:hypothetical protein